MQALRKSLVQALCAGFMASVLLGATPPPPAAPVQLKVLPLPGEVQVECRFRPAALQLAQGLDRNGDGRLDAQELEEQGATLAAGLAKALRFSVTEQAIAPASSTLTFDAASGQTVWQATLPVEAQEQPLTVDSALLSPAGTRVDVDVAYGREPHVQWVRFEGATTRLLLQPVLAEGAGAGLPLGSAGPWGARHLPLWMVVLPGLLIVAAAFLRTALSSQRR